MLDPVITQFFDERKAAWLKKNLKASMSAGEEAEKKAECDHIFDLETWLPNAARRAGSRAFSTHPSKFSHPSTGIGDKNKKNHTYVTPVICNAKASNDGFLRSGNISEELDSLGNAAELDVDSFLSLTMPDERSLLTHIEQDTTIAKALLTIKSQTYDELKQGFLTMTQGSTEIATSSKIKQVYFPVNKNSYHLLSLLTPSGIVFDLRKRLDTLRFGDEIKVKDIREKRKKGEYDPNGYREIYGLTTIGYGGTKPQNISVLNNKNGGKAHLLLSLPPTLEKRDIQLPNKDFFTQSFRYNECKEIFYGLHKLYRQDPNNFHIRAERDDYYQAIVSQVIEKMWQIRSVASTQYNPEYSQLKQEQKIWLLDGDFKDRRETEDDWLDSIIKSITNYIFHGYEKTLPKTACMLGDGEKRHMYQIVDKNREALR